MHRRLHRLGRIQTPAYPTPPSQHPLVKSIALPSPQSLPSPSSQPPPVRAAPPRPTCRQHPYPPPVLQKSPGESSLTSKLIFRLLQPGRTANNFTGSTFTKSGTRPVRSMERKANAMHAGGDSSQKNKRYALSLLRRSHSILS